MSDPTPYLAGPRWFGMAVCAIVLAGAAGFANVAPVSSAAVAPGVISHKGERKLVQHLDGGTIEGIGVQEGDFVRAGDVLLTMGDTSARAAYGALLGEFVHLSAARARLVAAEAETDATLDAKTLGAELAFPAPMPLVEEAIAVQAALLQGRKQVERSRAAVLLQRARQLQDENEHLDVVIAAYADQVALAEEEMTTVVGLLERGLERRPRLLALQREIAAIRADQAETEARVARNLQAIGEADAQRHALDQSARDERNGERAEIEARLATVLAELPAAARKLEETVVRAPVDGTVLDLRVRTVGGVVGAGEVLMAISPAEAPLIIDARVRPSDVEALHPGLAAKVVFTGLANRHLPDLYGIVRSISPDRLEDKRSGDPYFSAEIEITEALATLENHGLRLTAGMSADTFIKLGEATLLGHLSEPLTHSLKRAFTGT